jgi:hypothetical protein
VDLIKQLEFIVLPFATIFRPQLLFRRWHIATFLSILVLGFVRCAIVVEIKMP